MHPIHFYNTASKSKEVFTPFVSIPTMYLCGPTVYGVPHLGNIRSAVVGDMVYRLLRYVYGDCVYARNITDIDDKIIAQAHAQKCSVEHITSRSYGMYKEILSSLGVLSPTYEPRATEHIPKMIEAIEKLCQEGYAYCHDGSVWYRVREAASYGSLSRRYSFQSQEKTLKTQDDSRDFVLWKAAKDGEPSFESPWGKGRPGWHIECSAMIWDVLGFPVDVHVGGCDLMFPHHENELAQNVVLYPGESVRFWLHHGLVMVEGRKMAKSFDNIIDPQCVIQKYHPLALRYAFLKTHYKHPLFWSENVVKESMRCMERLKKAIDSLKERDEEPHSDVVNALCKDVNTPLALSHLFPLMKKGHPQLYGSARLLGLL